MAIPKKVINFFEKAKVKYQPIKHRTVYTAFDKAATLKVSQKIIGKTLVMRLDNRPAIILIPANKNLNIKVLKKTTKAKKIDFIKEVWMKKNLKGVKIGAIPPLGNLWKLPTFLDKSLTSPSEIIINSGDYNFSIKLKGSVFKKLMIVETSSHLPKRSEGREMNEVRRTSPRLAKQSSAFDLVIGNFAKTKK